jgi:hypothetical protein
MFMPSEKKQKEAQQIIVLAGIRRFISVLPQVLSIVVGLSILVYVLGWLSARAYYLEFGATWLLSEITIISLLGFSCFSLAAVLFFVYLGVTDLLESETRYKGTFFVIKMAGGYI